MRYGRVNRIVQIQINRLILGAFTAEMVGWAGAEAVALCWAGAVAEAATDAGFPSADGSKAPAPAISASNRAISAAKSSMVPPPPGRRALAPGALDTADSGTTAHRQELLVR